MKKYIAGVATGILLSCTAVLAVNYTATENVFPIKLNGDNVSLEGYNIDGSTYFKLRDISDTIGSFDVDFKNNMILLSKDGYKYTEEQLSQPYSKIYPNEGLIHETVDDECDNKRNWYGYIYSFSYHLPSFNINTADAIKINNKIHDDFYPIIEYSYNNMKTNASIDTTKVSYEQHQYKDILSLVVSANDVNDIIHYGAYSINTKSGEAVSNSELISMVGYNNEDFLTFLKNLTGNYYIEKYSKFPNYDGSYDRMYNLTLSDEFCNLDIPMYIDENGHLIVIANIGSMAGASIYCHVIDTGLTVD